MSDVIFHRMETELKQYPCFVSVWDYFYLFLCSKQWMYQILMIYEILMKEKKLYCEDAVLNIFCLYSCTDECISRRCSSHGIIFSDDHVVCSYKYWWNVGCTVDVSSQILWNDRDELYEQDNKHDACAVEGITSEYYVQHFHHRAYVTLHWRSAFLLVIHNKRKRWVLYVGNLVWRSLFARYDQFTLSSLPCFVQ